MKDLILALTIFAKYTDSRNPTYCAHDTFYVCVNPDDVSDEDKMILDSLGFIASDEGCFLSFRFGSC